MTTALHTVTFPTAEFAVPVQVTKATNDAGSASTLARSDHKHDISTAAAGASFMGDVAAIGSATSLARSDHIHDRSDDAALYWMQVRP